MHGSNDELPELRVQTGNAAPAHWYHKAFRLAVRGLFRLFFRIRVKGLRNVPRTPIIVCMNHLGWADAFMVLSFFPVEPRIYALGLHPGKVSAFRTRVIDALQIMVAVDPASPRKALQMTEDVLKRGG